MSRKAYSEAERLLLKQEQEIERALRAKIPRGGSGVDVRGSFPVFMVIGSPAGRTAEDLARNPYQLKFTRKGPTGATIGFTRGRVQAGSNVMVPTISGIPVDGVGATLPRLSAGGQVFAEYRWQLDPALTSPDWADVAISCELVQVPLGSAPPSDVLPYTGFNTGVDATVGVAHGFLMAYGADGRVLTYGQAQILTPDPEDLFPTECVIFAYPLVQYVD